MGWLEEVPLKELRLIWVFPLLIVVLSVVVVFYAGLSRFLEETEQSGLDLAAWQELRLALEKDEISQSILKICSPSGEVYSLKLTETEVSQFQEVIGRASFYRSNWRHEGPTPTEWWEVEIRNKYLILSYWGRGIFEIQSAGRTFLVLSQELGYWTEKSAKQTRESLDLSFFFPMYLIDICPQKGSNFFGKENQ